MYVFSVVTHNILTLSVSFASFWSTGTPGFPTRGSSGAELLMAFGFLCPITEQKQTKLRGKHLLAGEAILPEQFCLHSENGCTLKGNTLFPFRVDPFSECVYSFSASLRMAETLPSVFNLHSIQKDIHTYVDMYVRACVRACVHTYIHTCMHACMHAYMHAFMRSCMHACMHAYIHTYIHGLMIGRTDVLMKWVLYDF